MTRDRINGLERRLKALRFTIVRMLVGLQKLRVRIDLRRQQIWHRQDTRAFGETLANAFFLGERISHDISDLRQGREAPVAFIDWCWHGGWPLPTVADDGADSAIRPDLSPAVASEDKEKPWWLFFGFS